MSETGTGASAAIDRSWRILPADVVLGAILGVAAAIAAALAGIPWQHVVALAVLAAVAPALARIDVAVRRLPNLLTLPAVAVAALAALVTLCTGHWQGPLTGLLCALGLLMLSIAGGMGMGDLKLGSAIALAFAFDPWMPLVAVFTGFIIGGVVGAVALLFGRKRIPFGPALLAGAACALALGAIS